MVEALPDRLRRLRSGVGLSQAAVAKELGIRSPSVAQWEIGRSRPDIGRLPQLARLYRVTLSELCGDDLPLAAAEAEAIQQDKDVHELSEPGPKPNGKDHGLQPRPAPGEALARSLPVYSGVEVDSPDGAFELELRADAPVDMLPRPPGLAGARGAFAVYAVGESMWPWRAAGDPVHVHPGRPVRPSDYVLLVLRPESPGGPRRAMVKRLLRRGVGKVVVEQFNPRRELTFRTQDIAEIWRVVDWPELMA